jgi:hypothetical protein
MRDYRSAADMDQALNDKPPRIRWAPNGKGIQVAVEVDDPYAERPWRRNDDRPLPPENHDGCTCRGRCNIHEENR